MNARIAIAAAMTAAATLAPRADAAPPSLAGRTVLTGSSTAGIRVHLPRPVSVSLTTSIARVTGDGRAVGFALVPAARLADPRRLVYGHVRFGFCNVAGCRAAETSGGVFAFNAPEDTDRVTLPRGDYQLYLVADGRPVTVELTLPGLTGRTTIRPNVRNRFGPHTPTARVPGGSRNVSGAGDFYDFRGFGGISVQAVGLATGPWVAGNVGDCVYEGRPPVAQVAFFPRCPEGSGSQVVDGVVSPLAIHRQYYFAPIMLLRAGTLGHGAWYAAVGVVSDAAVPSFQLELDTIR